MSIRSSSGFSNAQTSLGIDFGHESTKVLALNKVGERIDISLAGAVDNNGSTLRAGVVTNPKEVGKRLKSFVTEHQVHANQPVFDVPSNLAVLRWITLPKMKPEERVTAAKFESVSTCLFRWSLHISNVGILEKRRLMRFLPW